MVYLEKITILLLPNLSSTRKMKSFLTVSFIFSVSEITDESLKFAKKP